MFGVAVIERCKHESDDAVKDREHHLFHANTLAELCDQIFKKWIEAANCGYGEYGDDWEASIKHNLRTCKIGEGDAMRMLTEDWRKRISGITDLAQVEQLCRDHYGDGAEIESIEDGDCPADLLWEWLPSAGDADCWVWAWDMWRGVADYLSYLKFAELLGVKEPDSYWVGFDICNENLKEGMEAAERAMEYLTPTDPVFKTLSAAVERANKASQPVG